MSRHDTSRRFTLAGASLLVALLGLAAAPDDDGTGAEPEDLKRWSHFHEVDLPEKPGKYLDFVLTPAVFGSARPDLGDLRLVDADGKTIPYALRVRTPLDETRDVPGKLFSPGTNSDHSVQATLDLGENPPEYDRVLVDVPGESVSRRLRVEGGRDGKEWVTMLDQARIVDLKLERDKRVEQREFSFPPARHRYLRLRVYPDAANDKDRPVLRSARAARWVREPGEMVTHPVEVGERRPVRQHGQPGSAWEIDLGEANVPMARLTLAVKDGDFTRPFELRGGNNEILSTNGMQGFPGDPEAAKLARSREGVQLNFPETRTRKFRLIVTDSRNQPLRIEKALYSAPVRQVIFALPPGTKSLRLYSGNLLASSPNYDFANRLPAGTVSATRASLGEMQANPDYVPPPKPWTERWPYLADVVLVLACAVLGGLLMVLARGAIRRHDATVPAG